MDFLYLAYPNGIFFFYTLSRNTTAILVVKLLNVLLVKKQNFRYVATPKVFSQSLHQTLNWFAQFHEVCPNLVIILKLITCLRSMCK